MSVTMTQLDNNNLLNLSTWTVGTGAVGGFPLNGATEESQRLLATNPYGQSAVVWQTNPNGDGNASGGWNGDSVAINNTKTYRFSVWVRRTSASTGGTFYHGLHTNGSGDSYKINDGGSDTNPYWCTWGIGQFNQDQWYLIVGHLFPNNYTGWAHQDSGIYTREGGKVTFLNGSGSYDFRMGSGATTALSRVYHFYTSNTADHLQFYSPRIEALESLTPTVDILLYNDLTSSSARAIGIVLGNGTIKATSTPQNGSLIQVQSFTSTGTWTKPSGCTNVIVQIVGGGGGAAYHQESGGGGGFSEKLINVSGVSSIPVTIGGGGGRVGYYAAAGDGGTSSFGSYCSASGGYGANRNYSHTGGHGGIGSGGDINLYGGAGTGHGSSGNNNIGRGGETFFGGCRGTSHSNDLANIYSAGYGTGGPGGGGGGRTGSDGMPGLITVYSYK